MTNTFVCDGCEERIDDVIATILVHDKKYYVYSVNSTYHLCGKCWTRVSKYIEGEPDPRLPKHPIVQAFGGTP